MPPLNTRAARSERRKRCRTAPKASQVPNEREQSFP
jgi:hypothetical protein